MTAGHQMSTTRENGRLVVTCKEVGCTRSANFAEGPDAVESAQDVARLHERATRT